MKHKALPFLCNNCGAKASLDLDNCPSCGVPFGDLVRCSQCHYEAEELQFHNGCPKCGYLRAAKRSKTNKKKNGKLDFHFEPLLFTLTVACFFLLMLVLLWLYDRLM